MKAHFDIVRQQEPKERPVRPGQEKKKKKKKDFVARTLYEKYSDQANRIMLLFIYPILKDSRRLTKLFQTKTPDNITIYDEIRSYFINLAKRVIKERIFKVNSVEQLCRLNLEPGTICLKSVEEIDFGESFSLGNFAK